MRAIHRIGLALVAAAFAVGFLLPRASAEPPRPTRRVASSKGAAATDGSAQHARPTRHVASSKEAPAATDLEANADADRWCAPELETIGDRVCFFTPSSSSKGGANTDGSAADDRTLVIFLHSLMGATGSFRWQQQRLMVRMANAYHFSALMPRGRTGIGPARDPAVIAWPTASKLQEEYENELIAEWMSAKAEAEKRTGQFKRVLVFGFSNGAYYATSLALRGRLDVDGYGVFAGGSGGKYSRSLAARAQRRAPIFVGYGTKDRDHRNQKELVSMLRSIGWQHRFKADRIGHTVSDAQVRGALAFLRGPDGAK